MRILILFLVLCSACKFECTQQPGYKEFMSECVTHLPYRECYNNAQWAGKLVCK